VANEGEDAFETMFFLNLPAGINYVKIQPQAGQQVNLIKKTFSQLSFIRLFFRMWL
jgi:Integrin alpha